MSSPDNDINQHFQDAIDVIQQHSDTSYYSPEYKYYETLVPQQAPMCQISCCLVTHPPDMAGHMYDWNDSSQPWSHMLPDVALGTPTDPQGFYPVLHQQRTVKGRKKLRLYEYLHEALGDPGMGDSIQWTDSGNGIFHFVSKNKEKLAECWGQRKGNRKTMTYQKMARALRNYSRTGEIIKVRRKLTYQFNPKILQMLAGSPATLVPPAPPRQEAAPHAHGPHAHGPHVHGPHVHGSHVHGPQPEDGCYGSVADWPGWYPATHYALQEHYELNPGLGLGQDSPKM